MDENADYEMRDEYDFSNSRPNPYAERYWKGTRTAVLDPDVAAVFPDSDSVNEALRALIRASEGIRRSEETRARQS